MVLSPANKEIVLLAGLVLASILFWLSLQIYLPLLTWSLTPLFWSVTLAFFFIVVLWGLIMILVESNIMAVVAWALTSFTPVLWLTHPTMIGASSILFIFGFIALIRGKNEMQNTLKGSLLRSLRKGIPLTVTCITLTVAVAAYMWSPQKTISIESLVPENLFGKLVVYLEPIISKQVPGFTSHASFAGYMLEQAGRQVKKDPQSFTKEERALIIQESMKQFQDQYHITIRPDDSLSHVLYLGTTNFLKNQLNSQNPALFPILFAAGLFLGLRLIALPVYWLGMLTSILIVRLLVKFGIVEIRAVPVDLIGYSFS